MTKPTGRPRGRPRKDGSPAQPKPPEPVNKGGRPPRDLDLPTIEAAASIGCSDEEIAAVVHMSAGQFRRRKTESEAIQTAIKRGQRNGRATLRRAQWQAAIKGNPTMLIWLGKNLLNQTDKTELTTLTPTELRRIADLARSEASRRGLNVDDDGRPAVGTLPH